MKREETKRVTDEGLGEKEGIKMRTECPELVDLTFEHFLSIFYIKNKIVFKRIKNKTTN